MYPILFQIGPFPISSFGMMMAIAFLLGNYLLKKDVVAEGYDPIIAEEITFRAAIGGILGSKIYYLIENINNGADQNLDGLVNIFNGIINLASNLISMGIQNFGSGLVFYGGLLCYLSIFLQYVFLPLCVPFLI